MATANNRSPALLESKENIVGGILGKTTLNGTKRSLCESKVRKRLGDISNLPRQSKLASGVDKTQFLQNTDKEYIDKLQKENTMLLELLADKNKIIEMNDMKLQKINMNMQKIQQQNFQLVRANGLMLVELNTGKERLKAMQHELGCTKSLLRAKEMELEEKLKIRTCQQIGNQVGKSKSEEVVMEAAEVDRHWTYHGLDHSIVTNEVVEMIEDERVCLETQPASFQPGEPEDKGEDMVSSKEKAEKKRVRPRRSSIFKPEEPKPKEEDMFEMTDTAKSSECSSSFNIKEGSVNQGLNSNEIRRSSIARPMRLAAKKILSYKEIPLTVKMRRPD